jgi:hypothetical protein
MKDQLAAVANGSVAIAQAVVAATSQKNIEAQKVNKNNKYRNKKLQYKNKTKP